MNTADNNAGLMNKVNVQIAAAKFNSAISYHVRKSSNTVKPPPSHAYCEVIASEIKLSPRLHTDKRSQSPPTAIWVVVEDENVNDDLKQCSLSDSLFSNEGSPAGLNSPKPNIDHQNARNTQHNNIWGSSMLRRQNMGGGFQPSPPSHSMRTSPKLLSAHNARSVVASQKRNVEKEKSESRNSKDDIVVLLDKVKDFYVSNFGEMNYSATEINAKPNVELSVNEVVVDSGLLPVVESGNFCDSVCGVDADEMLGTTTDQEPAATVDITKKGRIPFTIKIPTVCVPESQLDGDKSLGDVLASQEKPRLTMKLYEHKAQQTLVQTRLRTKPITQASKSPSDPIRIIEFPVYLENLDGKEMISLEGQQEQALLVKGGQKLLNRNTFSVVSRRLWQQSVSRQAEEMDPRQLKQHRMQSAGGKSETPSARVQIVTEHKKSSTLPVKILFSVPDDMVAAISSRGMEPGKVRKNLDIQQTPRSPRALTYLGISKASPPLENLNHPYAGEVPDIQMSPPPPS